MWRSDDLNINPKIGTLIKKEKDILKNKIEELINDFETKTGIDVGKINIEVFYMDKLKRVINTKITLNI